MTQRREFSASLAAQILQSVAAVASAGVVLHAAGCGDDVTNGGAAAGASASSSGDGAGGGGVTSSSVTSSVVVGGGSTPKAGVQCIPWPPDGNGGAGGTGGSSVASTGSGPCPSVEYATNNGSPDPYLSADVFCNTGTCCSTYKSAEEGTVQGGDCCYEVVANCTSGSGRPLVVEGRPLTATVRRGASGAWRASARPDVADLSVGQRDALAAAWLGDAMLEHASVASFSRFALELMAVGAPAELLDGAHQAARDEVRHARLCFALASVYAGHALEPGALPSLAGLAIGSDLGEVAARAVTEGCIGETVAALSAAEQLEAATDPAVREVLAGIAADEARHAALAWRFVAWAQRTGGPTVRDAIAAAFAGAVVAIDTAATAAAAADGSDPVLARHGRLGPTAQRAVAARAIDAVIRPAIIALHA
ncbi:MAG: ferritin-like domain-containing protein [Polyangiaceae bacterium]